MWMVIAQAAVHGDEFLRQQPIQFDRPVQPQNNHNLLLQHKSVVPGIANAEKIGISSGCSRIPASKQW